MAGLYSIVQANMRVKLSHKMIRIRIFTTKARLVDIFLDCSSKLHVDDKDLKAVLSHITRLAQKANPERLQLEQMSDDASELRYVGLSGKFHVLISGAEKKIGLIKPQMQEAYSAITNSRMPSISFSGGDDNFAVVKHVDALLDIVKELFVFDVPPMFSQNLMFVSNFLVLTSNWCTEHEKLKDLHTQAYSVIQSTSCLLYLRLQENISNVELINELMIKLEKIKPTHPGGREIYIKSLKACRSSNQSPGDFMAGTHFQDFLDSLLVAIEDLKVSSTISVKRRVDFVHWMLKVLRFYFVDPSIDECDNDIRQMLNNLFMHIKFVACEVACVIFSCYGRHWTKYQVRKLNLATSELLKEYDFIKQEARDMCETIVPTSMRFNFPQTNDKGFIEFVLQYLKKLQKLRIAQSLDYQFQEIYSNMFSLRMDFLKITEWPRENEELKDHWKRFTDIVYQTEYVVDLIFIENHPLWYHKLKFFVVMIEMKDIMKEINRIKGRSTETDDIALTLTDINTSSQFKLPAVNVPDMPSDYMELFEGEAEKITEQLTNGMTQLCVLSIVGMPGIGKTTLANAIYESHSVQLHFYVCARCCVTQVYRKRRLLAELLEQVSGRTDLVCGSEDDLALKLYRSLKGKRYLILIDDLWDDWHWNDLKASFPDDNNGSSILFTSRFHNIALQIGSRSLTFPLHQLSDVKSWELLQVKLFPKEGFPQELLQVGKQIARKCNGLPFALYLIAGILRNIEAKEDCWQQVENSLSKQLLQDQQGPCMDVLELSYNHLPDHLKPCFLYFAAFSEDKEFMTSKLKWLWIAEGFIQQPEDENGSLEDAAEKILNDLIARSLVIISKRRSDGGIKSSGLHDLLLEFALGKAKEEFFLQAGSLPWESDDKHVPYRLSANSRWDNLAALSKPNNLRIRPLLLRRFLPSNLLVEASKFLRNLGLLKVLDLGAIELQDFPDDICSFLHLRYLSLRCYSNQIPENFCRLSDLETFILKVTSSSTKIQLPYRFWRSKSLRHLKMNAPWDSRIGIYVKYDINLQTLSTPLLRYGNHSEKVLRRLPYLRKLSCIFLNSWDDSFKCNRFPVLDFLSRLESLKVECRGEVQHPCVFRFPQYLRKLTLRDFQLSWSELSAIGKLPNLQVLKLLRGSFVGDTWDMTEGEFLKLRFLKLQSLDIENWNVCDDHVPCLETLVVEECDRLEIPGCLGEIPTLQKIELLYCKSSARTSARIIQEKQKEFGNEQFVLVIKEKAAEDPFYHTSDNPEERTEQENTGNLEGEEEEKLQFYLPLGDEGGEE